MSKTILVVEDNENNMMLVRDVLQLKGYTVLEATTGMDGIRLALERNPNLDIQLPDVDGITALQRIREKQSAMPVLAVSASVMPDEQQKIAASGFNAYVTKPLNMKSFLETVEKFIGKA
jgi:two-component system, cell cycle response regulator DivK